MKALRGEAYQIAMDFGIDLLLVKDGIEKELMTRIMQHAFPKIKSEAKELYRAGHQEGGILSRQRGEPVTSYIDRRRRWWTKLQVMDNTINLSDETRGELMLDNARLTRVERLMVLTSTGNVTTFDAIAKALTDQHRMLHKEEKRFDKGNKGAQPRGESKGKNNWPKRQGFYSSTYEEEDYDSDDDATSYEQDRAAYASHQRGRSHHSRIHPCYFLQAHTGHTKMKTFSRSRNRLLMTMMNQKIWKKQNSSHFKHAKRNIWKIVLRLQA